MSKKVPLNLGGQMVEAEVVDFKIQEEAWSRYSLEDGTTIRIKLVVSDVYRLPNPDPMTGLPQVLVKSTNVLSVEPAEKFAKKEVN